MLPSTFLHTHDSLQQNPNHEHVVVDRVDWEKTRRLLAELGYLKKQDQTNINSHSKTYEFCVFLKDDIEFEKLVNTLFEVGCDDGTCAKSNCVCHIRFSREAESLDEAIRSAVADIQKAGYIAEHVEIGINAYYCFPVPLDIGVE